MPDRAIWDLLMRDHEEVARILDRLRSADESAAPELVALLLREITAHARAEEVVVYGYLLHDERARPGILAAFDEHKRIETAVAELERTRVGDERWPFRRAVVDDAIRQHFQVVETELLARARQIVSARQAGELGELFATERARVLADLSNLGTAP